ISRRLRNAERRQRPGAVSLSLRRNRPARRRVRPRTGVLLLTHAMREKGLPAHRLALSNARYMYWTVAQMVAHHTSNGCNLRPGDLVGTGTLSGPGAGTAGSILEATEGGRNPVKLAS